MEKLERYRQIVRDILTAHATTNEPDIESQVICDTESDRYLLLDIGWQGLNRIYACYMHLDIKDGKIWIQHNMTESDFADELVRLGVPKEDIVLGFHSPFMRQFTDYAVS